MYSGPCTHAIGSVAIRRRAPQHRDKNTLPPPRSDGIPTRCRHHSHHSQEAIDSQRTTAESGQSEIPATTLGYIATTDADAVICVMAGEGERLRALFGL